MNKKICIVTGANSGIGKQAAIQISDDGHHVILACRSREKGEGALRDIMQMNPSASVELKIVDLGLRDSIVGFSQDFNKRFNRLDVLIHNAAVFQITQKRREQTVEGIETVWATNHLGPVLMTQLLLGKLKKSDCGRILTIASKGLLAKPFLKVDLSDVEFKQKRYSVVNAYYQSKLAQVMYTLWLSDLLKDTHITANCIRVPAVKVDISRYPALSSFMKWVYQCKAHNALAPGEMAKIYRDLALSDVFNRISGKYFDEKSREVKISRYCRNWKNIDDVMRLTLGYIPEIKDFEPFPG